MKKVQRWKRAVLAGVLALTCAFPAYATNAEINKAKDKAASLEEEKK